jgi:drug/metabolite transporter (DMT)-like permease
MAIVTDNMRGAFLMIGAMAAFTVNDVFMKLVTADLPLFQALLIRNVGTTIFLIGMALAMGQLVLRAARRDWWLMVIRAGSEMGSAWFFITALGNMPFANLAAIMQSLPLTVTLAGALFLGEAVGWKRLTAILVGLIGVLMIVKPGAAAFDIYAVYGLATVICVTLRDIVSRMLSRELPSLMVAVVSAFGVTIFAGIGSLFVDWQPVTFGTALELGGAMIFIFGGYLFSVGAMRVGELGFVAPFRYTSLVAALILGVVVFGTFPDALTLLGVAIVVSTGLFTLWRERKLRRKLAAMADPSI